MLSTMRQSPALRRSFVVLSWLVLLAGLIVYLNVRSRSTDQPVTATATPAATNADLRQYGPTIPLPKAALQTAKQFLLAGVLRRDLAAAWDLAAPQLRSGTTRKQWLTGQIPVGQFPSRDFAAASYKVSRSRQRDVLLLVYVYPKKGSKVRGWDYYAELVPRNGRWLVAYWQPHGHQAPIPLAR